MNKYAIILRGINTGGLSLKMADLQKLLKELGYTRSTSIQASGNIALISDEAEQKILADVTSALSAFMKQPIHGLIRSEASLQALVSESDFSNPDYNHYILFCEEALFEQLNPAFQAIPHDETETLFGKTNDLHWIVKKGNTLGEFGNKVLGNKNFKSLLTSRNLNTVKKVLSAFEKL